MKNDKRVISEVISQKTLEKYDLNSENYIDTNKFISNLQKLKEDFKYENISMNIDAGCENFTIDFIALRKETEEEFNNRIKEEKETRKRIREEAKERKNKQIELEKEMLKNLLKKYGKEKV